MSTYFQDGNLIEGVNSTVTSGGTLALVASSKTMQRLTGTSTHTVTLPDATTLRNPGRRFSIKNRSTGSVTVNNFGGTLIATLTTNTQRDFVVSDVSTSNGVWELAGDSGSAGGGTASVTSSDTLKMMQGLAAINYNDSNIVSKRLKYMPEDMGGDFWVLKSSLSGNRFGVAGTDLNGYGYAIGGNTTNVGNPTDIVERYDDDNNYWLSRAVHPFQVANAKAFQSGGAGYAFGGGGDPSGTTIRKYVDSTNTWSQLATYGGSLTSSHGGAVVDSVPYFYANINGVTAAAITYDIATNSYASIANLATAIGGGGSFDLNGFAYLNGGSSQNTTSQKYDRSSNSWKLNKILNSGRQFCTGFSMQGFGYAAAGETASITNVVEEYNDFAGYWKFKQPLATNRSDLYCAGFSLNGYGYVPGGSFPGSALTATVAKYANSNLIYAGSFNKKTSAITAVLVATAVKNLASGVPVQLRTDGDNWKNFISNADSVLKFNEALTSKFKVSTMPYWAGGTPDNATAQTTMQFYNDTANTWTNRQGLASARFGQGSFTVAGKAYVFEGQGTANALRHSTEKYDDLLDSWVSAATITISVPLGVHGFEIGGFGYGIGGSTNANNYNSGITGNYKYDPTGNSWSTKAVTTAGIAGGYSATQNGRGFVAGGNSAGSGVATNYRYNDILDSWSTVAALTTARQQGCGGASLNGYGYAVGGGTANAEKYDDQANVWTNTSATSVTHSAASQSAPVANGFLYAAGNGFASATSEKYNDASNVWASIASPSANLAYGSSNGSAGSYRNYEMKVGLPTYIGGSDAGAWVVKANTNSSNSINGGWNLGGVAYKVQYNDPSEKYDYQSNVWRTVGSRNTGNSSSNGADFAVQGYGYMAGGAPITNAVERMNPATDVYTTMTSLTQATYIAGSSSLNGYGYVIGGTDNSTQISNNQQYNQSTNAWAAKTVISPAAQGGCFKMDALNGFIYHINQVSTNFNRYNDASDSWATMIAWPGGGSSYTVANEFRGELVTLAGYFGAPTTISYAYKDGLNAFILRPSLALATASGMGCNLNGTILSVGGYDASTVATNQTQQFVPSLNDIVLGVALEAK